MLSLNLIYNKRILLLHSKTMDLIKQKLFQDLLLSFKESYETSETYRMIDAQEYLDFVKGKYKKK